MNNKSRRISVSRAVTISSNPSVLHPCHRSLCFVPAGLLFGPVHNNMDTTHSLETCVHTHTYLHCAGFLNEGSIWLILTCMWILSLLHGSQAASRDSRRPLKESRLKLPVKPQSAVFHFSMLFWITQCECGCSLQFSHFVSLLHDRTLIHESRCQSFFLWRPNLKRNGGPQARSKHLSYCNMHQDPKFP